MADIDEKDRSRDSGRDRDRSRRGDRPSRFSEGSNIRDRSVDRGGGGGGGGGGRKSSSSRVYVSNISYEYRWQDLKDLFREKVGDVAFVELFVDDHDKPKGCGIVEFSDSASVKKCMEVMHRFELNGRKLVIKEDFGNERDKYGNIINGRRNRDRERQMDKGDWDDMSIGMTMRDRHRGGGGGGGGGGGQMGGMGGGGGGGDGRNWDNNPPSLMNLMSKEPLEYKWGNTYGLSPQFLESLNINRPLVNRVFVANLDYKVDEKKLREVFKLCGKVLDVELYHDKDGNSRGFAVVEYDHPVESVQAISMLHNQMLFDRPMIVRMDRIDHDAPPKLPEGLKGLGMGLGMNGEPLRDVSRNLPSQNGGGNGSGGGGGGNGSGGGGNGGGGGGNSGAGILGAMPNQSSLQALGSTAAALSSVVNNPTLAGLSGTSAAALQASLAGVQAPFLNQLGGLSSDIGLGNLTSSNLSSLSTSLAQNHALASLAGGNSMGGGGGGGSTGNLSSSLMARGLVGNSDRDYNSRNDNVGGASGYMLSSGGGPSNQQSNANQQQMVGNRGSGGGGGGGGRDQNSGGLMNDYTSSNARDYDSNASMRSQYDDMQDSFRQQTSIYSTVNNGSQSRTGSNNMNNTKGNGYSDTIIVSNLPISATWKMMREKFSNVGDVQFVDMKPKDNQAIIRFSSEWHAERAIKLMDRQRIDGRTIDVRFYY